MRRSCGWGFRIVGLAGLLLALSGAVRPADATNIFNGSSFVADGLTFTVSGCTDNLNSTGSIGCTNLGSSIASIVLGTGVRGADFAIEGLSGAPLFTGLANNKTDTLIFTLNTSVTSGSAGINRAQLSDVVSGTAGSSTLSAGMGGLTGFSATSLTLTSTSSTSAFTTDPSLDHVSIALLYDITMTQKAGGSLVLTSVTSIFNPAPEPISLSLFGVGLVGLGAVRRVRRRVRQTA